ncbi:hypothetical protein [Streptomyces sp. AM 2-1-1]|uniref:hypothetical protein n=1 Tax=Streptomyces sp. AM 2-1-1 TaxID=3028709 RepID=UPI0023B8C89D|nr:hypothetical protein [Streptomyces sp. AM 2-1-1]WEH40769.1 hypothetical protein PZB77_15355 [Streptomyces sp. AM 2-1-1]
MFGLTTRRLRAEVDAHLRTVRRLISTENLADGARRALSDEIDAHIATIRARQTAEDTFAAAPLAPITVHHSELWSLIDWTLWGSGMGDTFRQQLTDQFISALTVDQHQQALDLIRWWTEDRGRAPLGRRRYEDLNRRLTRALANVVRWRTAAHNERRTLTVLAEQLLDSTGRYPAAARATLGLPPAGPWERAVEGLNALVDAGESFHVEPDGHISNPVGDQHIEWDQTTKCWRLVHDEDDLDTAAMDGTR